MLRQTFIHARGVGPTTERRLWIGGVHSWEVFLERISSGGLPDRRLLGIVPVVHESEKALAAGRIEFFSEALPSSDQWRLFADFVERAAFVDIETTGLTAGWDKVTVIGLSGDRKYSGSQYHLESPLSKTGLSPVERDLSGLPIHSRGKQILTTMNHRQDILSAKDGIQLYVQIWEPESVNLGVVCLVHGLGEHSGRYLHLAEFLTQENYTLVAFDLRGHGKSQGKRGHTPSMPALLDDIDRVLVESIQRFNGKPHFLYGHSLGGLLVIAYAIQYHPQISGVISTGPILRTAFKPPAWKTSLGRLMRDFQPAFVMNTEVDPQILSHHQQIVRAYIADPLVHDRISARLGIDMLDLGIWALEHASEISTLLLLMHAGKDRLCSLEASREFAKRAGEICTLKGHSTDLESFLFGSTAEKVIRGAPCPVLCVPG